MWIGDLADRVALSQPTISHHIKQIVIKQVVDAGLATPEQRGKWAYVLVVDGAFGNPARTPLSV